MKKVVKIEGLDCPNCARALEKEINKIESVKEAKIDFVASKLIYESDDENALDEIVELSKKIEPNAKILEQKEKKINKKYVLDLSLLLAGIAIGVCVLTISMPIWLYWTLFVVSALLMGYKTYLKAIVLLFRGTINENLLITLSVIGAAAVGQSMESLMVIGLYSIGKILEGLAVDKSRKSIESIINLRPEFVLVLRNWAEERISPQEVDVGETILVKPGERVPIDGRILEGTSMVDLQSLTGESVPVSLKVGDEILSGAIVLDGLVQIETTKKYEDSAVSKILNLIENAQEKKSKTETLISKITKWYTLGVIVCSLLVFGIVYRVVGDLSEAIYRGLIFLVVSCPCAFAISVPLSYFSGIGNASKRGILIKGSNYLDACAKLNVVAFDKTGTLTTGEFEVEKVVCLKDGLSENQLVFLAALGEQNSLHPLAKSILSYNTKKLRKVKNVKEIAGHGVYFEFNKNKYFVGKTENESKNTIVGVYENELKIGEIELKDKIKEASFDAIKSLNELGVKTVLLSGDNKEIVEEVGKKLNVSTFVSNLLPEDKFEYIQNLKKNNKNLIGYVGDGINDAPSLTLADVGISMGIGGSPASVEASDIVLVDDNPKKVSSAIKISKFTRKIVWEDIILSAGVKFCFLLLGAIGITGMLSAVFADVGVTVLAILNSIRALKYNPK